MHNILKTAAVLGLCACAAIGMAWGQGSPQEETAIRQALASYGQAFSKGQAPAAGPAFTETAVYITASGERVVGRAALVQRLTAYLAKHKGDQLSLTATSITFVTPEVASIDGTSSIRGPGGPPDIGPFNAVMVKSGGRWMIQIMRDLGDPPAADGGTPAEHVQDLAWMVGEWTATEAGGTVRANCRFDASKNFLLWDYTVQAAGKDVMSVNQRVGWDAQTGQFRSWVFDSVGGFAQGRWEANGGGAWEIRQTGVLPDGGGAAATCQLIPVTATSFRWRMTDRRVNGAKLADVDLRFTKAAGR